MTSRTFAAVAVAAVWLGAGCAYYNTFYHARQNWDDAEKARLEQPDLRTNKKALDLYEKCMRKCAKVLTDYDGSRWVDDALLMMGRCAVARGEYATGQRKFEELIQYYPDSPLVPQARFEIGKGYLEEGAIAPATAALQAVVDDPKVGDLRSEAQFQLGLARLAAGDSAEAVEMLETFVAGSKTHPERKHALEIIADVNFARGDMPAARAAYERVKPHPRREWASYRATRLAVGRTYRIEGRMDDARREYDALLPLTVDSRDSAEIWEERGLIARDEGNDSLAVDLLGETAVRFARTDGAARALYARAELLYHDFGDLEGARRSYDSVSVHTGSLPEVAQAKESAAVLGERIALDDQLAARLQRIEASHQSPADSAAAGADTSIADADEAEPAQSTVGDSLPAQSPFAAPPIPTGPPFNPEAPPGSGLAPAPEVSVAPPPRAPVAIGSGITPGPKGTAAARRKTPVVVGSGISPAAKSPVGPPFNPADSAAGEPDVADASPREGEVPPADAAPYGPGPMPGGDAAPYGPMPMPQVQSAPVLPAPPKEQTALAASAAPQERLLPPAAVPPDEGSPAAPAISTSEYLADLSDQRRRELYAKADSTGREELAGIFLRIGEVELMKLGRTDLAAASYETVTREFADTPQVPQALLALAWIEQNRRDHPAQAESLYRKVLADYAGTRFAASSSLALGIEGAVPDSVLALLAVSLEPPEAAEPVKKAAQPASRPAEKKGAGGEEQGPEVEPMRPPPGFESAEEIRPAGADSIALRSGFLDSTGTQPPPIPGQEPPRVLSLATPVFPQELADAGVKGNVTVDVTVGPAGLPTDARVTRSDNPDLDGSAVEAALRTVFAPPHGQDHAVITFTFPPEDS